MKKKSIKRRWPYFFGQRIHGSDSGYMPELVKPESEVQRGGSGIQDILRWADDGGKVVDLEKRTTWPDPDDPWKRRNKR